MTQRVGLEPQRDEYMIADMANKGDPIRLYSNIQRDPIRTRHRTYVPT